MKKRTHRACRQRATPRPLDNERGLALVIVLAVVALLTILVTEFTFNTQLDQHRTRNAIHAMQAQLLARSGINLAEGFLMLDEEPAYDAYTEDWYPQMVEFCKGIDVDPTMRIRCTVRDESGKININNTREPRRKVESQSVTGSAVLRDAMRCMFERRGIDVEVVDKLADYWQQEAPPNEDGTAAAIPDFTSLEDFAATFRIPSRDLQSLRNVMTAQPRALLPRINVNTAPSEVLASVLNAEQEGCPPTDAVGQIVERQRDPDQPFRASGDLNGLLQGVDNLNVKTGLFGVQSKLFRLEASALTNVDPDNPDSGGIGQTVSSLVARNTSLKPKANNNSAPQTGADGKPIPNWTLRPLDWQKEGGARLFRPTPGEDDEDQPGNMDQENAPADPRG